MSLSTIRIATPYAIAFPIEELVQVRHWAEQRDLRLTVATDQVLDGAEFEEMLIISPRGQTRRTLTIWRSHATVYAQTPTGRPRAFASVSDLLDSLRPNSQRPRGGWRRLIGLAS